MLQNLKYVIFTVKMLLKKGHSTSKNLTIFYCSIHGLFKNHPIFEINHMSDGSFENFVIFRPLIINFFCFDQIQNFFEANIFYHGKGCYAQWASNSVKKCLPQSKNAVISWQERFWVKIAKTAIARVLLLRIQKFFGHEAHIGQGFQTCQIGPDPSPSPFLLLATPEKNRHLNLLEAVKCQTEDEIIYVERNTGFIDRLNQLHS